ncbi:MAG TPA: phosphotransferase [Gammaproteobacteria bacterium]|nr:phosphotransferase [Gammaproteobacteria bacterium]
MTYRVCIPTAGTGSRLGKLTQYINKSLISIAHRPLLSHVIEQFPEEVDFVIALGHKGHLVREFLELAYPHRRFFFAEVSPFEGPGSGLGLSLLACQPYLQQPFSFISCDTLVKGPIPKPDHNWIGYADTDDLHSYRTLALQANTIKAICEKGEGKTGSHKPYIGFAGIYEYQTFWSAIIQGGDEAIQMGETYGLRKILNKRTQAYAFTWYDTGHPKALARARKVLKEPMLPNILEKSNESIWFVKGHVIKFCDDPKFISHRVKRAQELQGFIPELTGSKSNMYRYPIVEGQVLSEVITLPLFEKLLNHCKQFWLPCTLDQTASKQFRDTCLRFYREKTNERIELFYKNFNRQDGNEIINGIAMPTLRLLLDKLDWNWLAEGLPGRFHGDCHFENILWSESHQKFTFLDWRQDFGGNLTIGDIYYDFAKLLHGLIISHQLIVRELFSVKWMQHNISYDFHRTQLLVECEQYFNQWLEKEGHDRKKVRILTALIYLNIAALHHHPYSLLLFALGKEMLFKERATK